MVQCGGYGGGAPPSPIDLPFEKEREIDEGRLAGLEILDLIDELGTEDSSPEAFCAVVRAIGDKARTNDSDRECFGDFEGFQAILTTLKKYGGEDGFMNDNGYCMKSLCLCLPSLCYKSAVNRGIIRDEGALEMLVNFLSWSVEAKNVECCTAACMAIKGACLANDGNKKVASRLREELNEQEMYDTDCKDPSVPMFKRTRKGALDLILDALEAFTGEERSVDFLAAAFLALRALVVDDDARGNASMLPSAVENRDYVADETHFPLLRKHIAASFKVSDNLEDVRRDLLEVLLQLTKEVAYRQDRIHEFVDGEDMLATVRAILNAYSKRPAAESDSIVRSCIALLRQFAFSDELKEKIGAETDTASTVLVVLKQRAGNQAITEQAFGLFSNLTLRKMHIAEKLNAEPGRLVAIARLVLEKQRTVPGVTKTVLQTLRNASKVPEALEEMREHEVFELIRCIVMEYKDSKDDKWHSGVEIGRQFLREVREDDCLREKPRHNDYY